MISGSSQFISLTTSLKELNAKTTDSTSSALIKLDHNKKYKNGTKVLSYESYWKTIHHALAMHKSNSSHVFPSPVIQLIMEYSSEMELTSTIPSPLGRQFISSIGFGKDLWHDYFGDIGEAPPLPANICNILLGECPFFKGKTVMETHMLVLIPATLKGTPMTIGRLGYLMKGLRKPAFEYLLGDRYTEAPFKQSHWILMTNGVPVETLNKSYPEQRDFVHRISKYKIPELAQAITAIFTEYLTKGIYRYGDDPVTYTRCQEIDRLNNHMFVGGYRSAGLIVDSSPYDSVSKGVGAVLDLV